MGIEWNSGTESLNILFRVFRVVQDDELTIDVRMVFELACAGKPERSKGFLTWEARLRIARGVAQGIAHIHECSSKNYVHGDIKPANILLDAFLEARVADFGLQRLLALVEPESLKEVGSTRGDNGTRVPSPG